MTTDELVDLIATLRRVGTDSLQVEAKRAERELPKRMWETLSAFANTRGGGVIILGLDEAAGFAATGVRDAAKVMQDLASLCDQMEPPLRVAVDVYPFEGTSLVVAEVPEVDRTLKPCHYRGAGLTNGAFIRVGDGDRKLTSYEVQLMLASRGQPREDEMPVPEATPDDLDAELVGGLLQRLRQAETTYFRQLDDDRALHALKVLVRLDDRSVPSLDGLLALGTYPQQFFPQLDVTFVAYPSPALGEPGPRGERFLDNRRARSCWPSAAALRRSHRYVRSHVPRPGSNRATSRRPSRCLATPSDRWAALRPAAGHCRPAEAARRTHSFRDCRLAGPQRRDCP